MELLQLRYFRTVAEMQNITRAAEFHRIPQPAMSKSVSRLERELGVSLFQRVNNRIFLTGEGRALYEGVSAGLSAIDSALMQIRQPGGGLRGEVRLLVQQHRSTLVDCISSFRRLHPQVSFHIFHKDEGLHGNYDMRIASSTPSGWDDVCIPLMEEEIRIAVSRDHPLAGREKVRLAELKEEAFLFTSRASSMYGIVSAHCEKYGFSPRIFALTDDLYCIEKYVANGIGITAVPMISWASLFAGNAVLLKVDEPDFLRRTFLFRNSRRMPSPAARAFEEHFQSHFRQYCPPRRDA